MSRWSISKTYLKHSTECFENINPLKMTLRPLYLKTQSVPRNKHGYKNQSVYAVSGTSRCLFSGKYKTHKYSIGRVYSCWMLNWWCITWPVGFKRLRDCSRHSDSLQVRRSGDRIPVKARFSAPVQTGPEVHPPSIQWVPGLSRG